MEAVTREQFEGKGIEIQSGTECMGTSYRSATEAAVANLTEWVTAGGMNSLEDAIKSLNDSRDEHLSEMLSDGWAPHEEMVDDWDDIADRAKVWIKKEMAQ